MKYTIHGGTMRLFVGIAVLLSAVGCSGTNPFDPRNLSYDVRTDVVATNPTRLEATVIARNISGGYIKVNGNHCFAGLKAWREPQREGPPAWDSRPAGIECAAIAISQTLVPGDFVELHLTGTLPADLPKGVYYLSADVDFIDFASVPAGQINYF